MSIHETNDPVDPGEVLGVTAQIENIGDTAGLQPVVLQLDGEEVTSNDLSLEPGATSETTLSYTTDESDIGTHRIDSDLHDEERTEVIVGESVTPSLALVDYHILGSKPDDEYVTIRNTGENALDASDWTMEDAGLVPANTLSPFEFPNGFTLDAGADVTTVTGDGDNTNETLYWGVNRHIWNEDGDTVTVRDGDGAAILEEPITAEEPPEEEPLEESPEEEPDEE